MKQDEIAMIIKDADSDLVITIGDTEYYIGYKAWCTTEEDYPCVDIDDYYIESETSKTYSTSLDENLQKRLESLVINDAQKRYLDGLYA